MATALIKVDAVAGRPAIVKALGTVAVTLTNTDNTGVVSWLWTVVQQPPTATAALSNPAIAAPTYGPLDADGTYQLRLAVNGGTGDWVLDPLVDEIVVRVRHANSSIVIPAPGETTQGGTDGWADWVSGMNDALDKLSALNTLQQAYTNSGGTPRIVVTPAGGPVLFKSEAVSNTHPLQVLDSGGVARLDCYNFGGVYINATLGAPGAAVALSVDGGPLGASALGRLFQVVDTKDATYWIIDRDNSVVSRAIYEAGHPIATAYSLDARGAYTDLLAVGHSLGSGGDPVNFTIGATGYLSNVSKSATYGFYLDAKAALSGVALWVNSSHVAQMFLIDADGQVTIQTKDASALTGLHVNAPNSTGQLLKVENSIATTSTIILPDNGTISRAIKVPTSLAYAHDWDAIGWTAIFRFQDSATPHGNGLLMAGSGALAHVSDAAATYGLQFVERSPTSGMLFISNADIAGAGATFFLYPDGKMISTCQIGNAQDGWAFEVNSLNAGANSLFKIKLQAGASGVALFPDVTWIQHVGNMGVDLAATDVAYDQDWSGITGGVIGNGETKTGFRAYLGATHVDGTGKFRGFRAVATAAGTGTDTASFQSEVAAQDTHLAYKVGVGADGVAPYVGYDHFGVADAHSATWVKTMSEVTGNSSCWTSNAGAKYLTIPLHLPPGCILDSISLHVNATGANVYAYLMQHDDTDGASADQQTQVWNWHTGAGGEQDMNSGALSLPLPRQGGATQSNLWILIKSVNIGDIFYCGWAKYTYNELLLGD